ncbi:MAG TPA: tRNA (N6-threonylcarbamoyladenosine(37)-N6)-methyltransferase TrmO [Syntrophales bacterium]|nr:tRNA (N6-threonylcarbamoyladenosine(37)-N6)-methyltransferase TrmO [Syntrophales bacterium]
MDTVSFTPIGIIHSPFTEPKGMPIQSAGSRDIAGTIEIEPRYAEGLNDVEGFSHIILIYHFHRAKGHLLRVKPFLDDTLRGVFATRAPRRPNPIGLSVVRLTRVEGTTLYIEGVDIIDGTPLLDIKPYIPQFDDRRTDRIGWLSEKVGNVYDMKADERFK